MWHLGKLTVFNENYDVLPTIIVIRHKLLLKATNQIQAHNLRLFCPGAAIRLFKDGFQKGFVMFTHG